MFRIQYFTELQVHNYNSEVLLFNLSFFAPNFKAWRSVYKIKDKNFQHTDAHENPPPLSWIKN